MSKAEIFFEDRDKLDILIYLMKRAGDSIMEIYSSDSIQVENKDNNSPLTEADLAAHHILVDGLKSKFPSIPIVSEEDRDSLIVRKTYETYWLIDPLDGTKDFIQKTGEFTCNLALINCQKAVMGLVGVPAKGSVYYGGEGFGAHRVEITNTESQIYCSEISGITRVVASKNHMNKETEEFIAKLSKKVELIQAGSSLKFIKIAEGQADLYPRLAPTCEWDTAAAQAVLEGAGGKIIQLNGEPLVYSKSDILNPSFIAHSGKYKHF